jgi:hypothetical protein
MSRRRTPRIFNGLISFCKAAISFLVVGRGNAPSSSNRMTLRINSSSSSVKPLKWRTSFDFKRRNSLALWSRLEAGDSSSALSSSVAAMKASLLRSSS